MTADLPQEVKRGTKGLGDWLHLTNILGDPGAVSGGGKNS